MKGQCRGKTDGAFRDELGGFSQRMMRIEQGIGKLIKSPTEMKDETFLLHSRHGCCRDTGFLEFGKAKHALLLE
jgi:hypothetical protein